MNAEPHPRQSGRSPVKWLARRAVLSFLAAVPACASLRAQPVEAAFDYRSEIRLPRPATALVRGEITGDGIPDVLLAGYGYLTLLEQGSTSFEWKTSTGPASPRTPFLALSGRLNADSRDDIVLLCGPRPLTAEIYLSRQGKVPALASTIELQGDFQQAALADLDADRNADLLFYGKKSLGIAVYTGNGRGGFTEGPVLFPELSVSQAGVARMDVDEMADIVLVDWIRNRLEVFPGFGGLNYGDPVVLPFDDEPVAIALADLDADGYTDIIAGFGEHPGFLVLGGDGRGNYAPAQRGELSSAPGKIRIGDVDADARLDVLLSLPATRSVVLRYQDGTGGFASQQSYSSGTTATDVVFFQDARKRYLNSAVLSSDEGIVRILHNRSSRLPAAEGWTFATGSDPADLEIADLNDDGWADVALTHSSEPVLNFFLNNGRGDLNGQASLRIPTAVTSLIPIRSVPGERDFLGTVPGGAAFAHISLSTPDLTARQTVVRTDAALEPIDGRVLPGSAGRRVYALKEDGGGRSATIYSYDIVDRTRYEETDMPLDGPARIAAVSAYDFDGDNLRDLAILTAPDTGTGCLLTVYRQADDGFAPGRGIPLEFSAAKSTDIALWIADLDADGSEDLVLNARKPDNTLFVAIARGDTAFGAAVPVLQDVRIPSRKSLSVTDFDADGRTDLVFVNEKTRTVQFLPGDGRGGYVGPVNLTSARGVSGFGVADINRDRENELILTIADEGILSVTSFHHPLFERKKHRQP